MYSQVLVALALVSFLTISSCEDIKINFMEKNGVVRDVIDQPPPATLEVVYPNKVKVDEGKELTPTQAKEQPTVKWSSEDDSYYALIMTDPDAPSRLEPSLREWHHWIVGNIPGNDISKGETLSEYVGAGPPKGTGLHRYVFLVYKQPSKIEFTENKLTNRSGEGRGRFSSRKFAKKYNLGEPIAGNVFQARWDNYVPILYKQLKG